jgi:hypothetical protein
MHVSPTGLPASPALLPLGEGGIRSLAHWERVRESTRVYSTQHLYRTLGTRHF